MYGKGPFRDKKLTAFENFGKITEIAVSQNVLSNLTSTQKDDRREEYNMITTATFIMQVPAQFMLELVINVTVVIVLCTEQSSRVIRAMKSWTWDRQCRNEASGYSALMSGIRAPSIYQC